MKPLPMTGNNIPKQALRPAGSLPQEEPKEIKELEEQVAELKAEKHALELLCEGKELSKDELRQKIKQLEERVAERDKRIQELNEADQYGELSD